MRAAVKPENFRKKGEERYRVVDKDDPEESPILNRSGEPIDGGGHKVRGISEMLAGEVNEAIERKTGKPVKVDEDE